MQTFKCTNAALSLAGVVTSKAIGNELILLAECYPGN